MTWQDAFVTMATFMLSIGLFGSVFSRSKPSMVLSGLGFLGSLMLVAVDCSYHLVLSPIAVGICALLWLLLFIQVLKG